ncbi:hypothetical protein BHM03_00031550 [Ensete ventricosum]|nr:hypothetical protein BHM03_00031550 [Ensete ventricosum]
MKSAGRRKRPRVTDRAGELGKSSASMARHATLMGMGRGSVVPGPPPRITDWLPTWSLGLTWLPPKCYFGIEWSAHPISNVPPNLSDEETNVVEQLKGILSASWAIRNLTEEWLVKASLSPASRGMLCPSV